MGINSSVFLLSAFMGALASCENPVDGMASSSTTAGDPALYHGSVQEAYKAYTDGRQERVFITAGLGSSGNTFAEFVGFNYGAGDNIVEAEPTVYHCSASTAPPTTDYWFITKITMIPEGVSDTTARQNAERDFGIPANVLDLLTR